MTDSREYAFSPYRAPVPYVALLLLFPLLGFVVAGLLGMHAQLPPRWAFTCGGVFALTLAGYVLNKDNRLHPAGVLRLMPGRLVYTADALGPLHINAEDMRDMVVSEGRLIVRQKHGRSLILHVERLPVPLATLQAALRDWVDHAAKHVGERFAEATDRAERFEARRQQVARVAGRMQRATDRFGWLLKLFGR